MRRFLIISLIAFFAVSGASFLLLQGKVQAQDVEIFVRPSGKKPSLSDDPPPIFNRQNRDIVSPTQPGLEKNVRGTTAFNRIKTHEIIERREIKESRVLAMLGPEERKRQLDKTQNVLDREYKKRIATYKQTVENRKRYEKLKSIARANYQKELDSYNKGEFAKPRTVQDYLAFADREMKKLKIRKNQEAGRVVFDVR